MSFVDNAVVHLYLRLHGRGISSQTVIAKFLAADLVIEHTRVGFIRASAGIVSELSCVLSGEDKARAPQSRGIKKRDRDGACSHDCSALLGTRSSRVCTHSSPLTGPLGDCFVSNLRIPDACENTVSGKRSSLLRGREILRPIARGQRSGPSSCSWRCTSLALKWYARMGSCSPDITIVTTLAAGSRLTTGGFCFLASLTSCRECIVF